VRKWGEILLFYAHSTKRELLKRGSSEYEASTSGAGQECPNTMRGLKLGGRGFFG
jgi:hypothetical protein